MRRGVRLLCAALMLAVLLHAPLASALSWEDWKKLIRERPVAVLVATPAFVVTAPFYGGTWLVGKATGGDGGGGSGSDEEDADEDEDYEDDSDDESYDESDEGDEGEEEE